MAITKLFNNFSNFAVTNTTGGASNTYGLTLTESVEVTIEAVNDTIQDGQTLPAGYDVSIGFTTYNTNAQAEPKLYGRDTSAEPTEARIIMNGATGSESLNIGNCIWNVAPDYSNNRAGFRITGTKRVTNVDAFIIRF